MQPERNDLFKTDNSSSTNLRYDIVVGKIMTSARNHERYSSRTMTATPIFHIIGAVIELTVALIMFGFLALKWIFKKVAMYSK